MIALRVLPRGSSEEQKNVCVIVVLRVASWGKQVQGYFNYYAVPGNLDSLGLFRERVLRYWGQALQRRSQIRRYAWVRRLKLAAQWLPTPRLLHPWPLERFAATHRR